MSSADWVWHAIRPAGGARAARGVGGALPWPRGAFHRAGSAARPEVRPVPPAGGTEAERIEWLPLAEIPALIDQGAIVSGPTLIALLYLLTTRDRPGLLMPRDRPGHPPRRS